MSYTFVVDGETFTGKTISAAGVVNIYQPKKKRMVATFCPETTSLFSDRASGAWSAIHPDTSLTFLEKIQPQVVAACKQRIMSKHA